MKLIITLDYKKKTTEHTMGEISKKANISQVSKPKLTNPEGTTYKGSVIKIPHHPLKDIISLKGSALSCYAILSTSSDLSNCITENCQSG